MALVHKHIGIVGRNTVRLLQPTAKRRRQFAQLIPHALDIVVGDRHRQQIRLGKISIVARILFAALSASDLGFVVPATRLLGHARITQLPTGLVPLFDMALRLIRKRALYRTKTIHVLDLDDWRRDGRTVLVKMQVDVGIDSQAALLHIAIGHSQVDQQQFHFGQKRLRFRWRSHVRVADDFQQGRTTAIQIDTTVGFTGRLVVHTLAGVLFQMRSNDAYAFRLERRFRIADLQKALPRHRQVKLAGLIALGQIRIVVILAIPLGELRDLAIQRQRRPHR